MNITLGIWSVFVVISCFEIGVAASMGIAHGIEAFFGMLIFSLVPTWLIYFVIISFSGGVKFL